MLPTILPGHTTRCLAFLNLSNNVQIMYAYLESGTVFSVFSKQLEVPELWWYLQSWFGPLF
jgi:hypothetical protein